MLLKAASVTVIRTPTAISMVACTIGRQLWHFRQAAIPALVLIRYNPSIVVFAQVVGIFRANLTGM